MALLTDKNAAPEVTLNDLVHIVDVSDTTENPLGSSKKASIQQLRDLIASSVDQFTELSDTPANYIGAAGYGVRVNGTADGLEFYALPTLITNFLGLTDTPSAYAGAGGYFVTVNSTPDGLQFVNPANINVSTFINNVNYVVSGANVSVFTNDAGYITSNITHTGEVTGLATLALDKTAITNKATVTSEAGDFVLISDTSDTGNLKKVDVAAFLAAGADGNGIYTGSGSLSGVTNISQSTFTLNYLVGAGSGKVTIGNILNHAAILGYNSAGAETWRLDAGGSSCYFLTAVGVNMTGGTARLSVKALGTGTDQVQRWRNSTDAANLMVLNGNGNLSIGAGDTPTAKLHVGGNTQIDGQLNVTSNGVGFNVTNSAATRYFTFNSGLGGGAINTAAASAAALRIAPTADANKSLSLLDATGAVETMAVYGSKRMYTNTLSTSRFGFGRDQLSSATVVIQGDAINDHVPFQVRDAAGTVLLEIKSGAAGVATIKYTANYPEYADDTAAGAAGLLTGMLYVETTSGNRYVASKS